MRCICLPRCLGGGVHEDGEGDQNKDIMNDNRPHVHRKLNQYFTNEELTVLGDLANRVRVLIDPTLPNTLHGTSRVTLGVPLAVVNPKAPDRRYVILHELMHHQLDELGCPSLCCTVKGMEPQGSWLRETKFQNFVRGLLVQLWELIQHSRFNPMLARVFRCGPESARDGEYKRYIAQSALPMYGMCGQNGNMAVRKVAVSAHVATCMLEASPQIQKEFKAFVRSRFSQGPDMIALGEKLHGMIKTEDVELLKLSRSEMDALIRRMLGNLKVVRKYEPDKCALYTLAIRRIENLKAKPQMLQDVLTALDTGMTVKVGPVKPLKELFNGRCSTVSEVDFHPPTGTVMATAGGFGAAGAEFGGIEMTRGPEFPGMFFGNGNGACRPMGVGGYDGFGTQVGLGMGMGMGMGGLVCGAGLGSAESEWVSCSCCSDGAHSKGGSPSLWGVVRADLPPPDSPGYEIVHL